MPDLLPFLDIGMTWEVEPKGGMAHLLSVVNTGVTVTEECLLA